MRALIGFLLVGGCASPAAEPARPAPRPAPTGAPLPLAQPAGESPRVAPVVASGEPEPLAPEVAQPPAVPTAPASEPSPSATARDPRRIATQHRPRSLLILELQALEKLYAATPKRSPDRPTLMRRLAEGYVELEYAAQHEADGAKIVAAARKHALTYYLAVRSEYPTYAKLDEVLYFAGYEHERAGDTANARALYRELTRAFPASSFVARVPEKWRAR